jgi:phosphatidylserine/phosphatidylglycerophosphate/cardiolipin synthase-like enzyme
MARFRFALLWLSLLLFACAVTTAAPPTREPTLAPVGGANNVGLLVFPDDDESLLNDRVAAARSRVYLKIYLLTDSRVFDALSRAQANGADVRVLIEANPVGGNTAAKSAINRLDEAGIPVKTANPIFRLTHEKSFVIDNDAVIFTANMTRSSFTRNREFGVIHSTPADVDEIARAFDADWRRASFEPASPNLVWSPVNSRERINRLIESARESLIVYAASSKDDEQIALLAAARKRGVDVRVLTSPPRSGDTNDPDEPDLDTLQRARAKVRYLTSPIVHAKVFVADGRLAFVGSVNISAQSLDFNRELGILVSDPKALARIGTTFESDWARASER